MRVVPTKYRRRRRWLWRWICSVYIAGLSIGFTLLVRVNGFNSTPSFPGGGRPSLDQQQRNAVGLPSAYSERRQERAVVLGEGWDTSRRRGRRISRLGDASGQQQLNGHGMDEGLMGRNLATRGEKDVTGWNGGIGPDGGEVNVATVTNAAATKESMEAAAKQSVPLKVMVFIDGTWLYYSFFGRGERCHVSAKLGPGWVYDYKVKWEMLPVIISRAVHAQLAQYGQSSRLVEVVRTVVFSSARKDTDKDSNRMRMFNAMREKNFEVHMATTMGVQEKCIDIALAVEMMHYATIPDTYDVGVLVTGDKDFMPAMARTRQKGRRVCLCSMRNSCNQDLLRDDAHVMDFQPVWINEYLDDLMEYAPPLGGVGASYAKVAPEILCQVVIKLMEQRGGSIDSRDLGRELNRISVDEDGNTALSVIKETWQSLSKFLVEHNDVFQIGKSRPDPQDPKISQFSISRVASQNSMKSLKLGEVVEESVSESEGGSDDVVYSNHDDDEREGVEAEDEAGGGGSGWGTGVQQETKESLSLEVIPQLKERLRSRGLPVSGKKADLIARLLESVSSDGDPPSPPAPASVTERRSTGSPSRSGTSIALPASAGAATAAEVGAGDTTTAVGGGGGGSGGLSEGWAAAAAEALIAGDPSSVSGRMPGGERKWLNRGEGRGSAATATATAVDGEEQARDRRMSGYTALVNIVSKALDNSAEARAGGVTSSRALGRELSRIPSPENPNETALTCLKSRWPSLMAFLKACPSDFTVTDIGKTKEFGVLKNDRVGGAAGDGGGWGGADKPSLGGGRFEDSRHGTGWNRPAIARAAAAVTGVDGRHTRSRRGG